MESIVPWPLLGSPPEADHVTAAAPPPEFMVAENCSTGLPDEFFPLHPTQLVSILVEPGEMLKVPLVVPAIVVPPHPANTRRDVKIAKTDRRATARRRLDARRYSREIGRTPAVFVLAFGSIKFVCAFKIV